jgi:hypothetical protein
VLFEILDVTNITDAKSEELWPDMIMLRVSVIDDDHAYRLLLAIPQALADDDLFHTAVLAGVQETLETTYGELPDD